MATGADVLLMLCPQAEYYIYGSDYENINWFDKKPAITKKQYEDGFAQYDTWKTGQDATKETQRQTLLSRLGITEEEARILLGGN